MADIEEPVQETFEEEAFAETPAAEEDDFIAAAGATEVKLFGKWSFDDIDVRDMSLVVRSVRVMSLDDSSSLPIIVRVIT